MGTESNVDYEAVLADLEAKRAALDSAIAAIKQILGRESGSLPVPVSSNRSVEPQEIPRTAFHGFNLPGAIKAYLGMVKRKQSTKEILDALQRGGFMTTAKSHYSNTYTGLVRLEKSGQVARVGDDWGLAEWYPALRKDKTKSPVEIEAVRTTETTPKKRRKKRGPGRPRKSKPEEAVKVESVE